MTKQTGGIYAKNDIELSWSIKSGIVCDKNQLENNMTDRNGMIYTENDTKHWKQKQDKTTMWLIV